MKKTMRLAVISALAVVLSVALVSLLHSAPPDWANPGAKPLWEITEANWVDHTPNTRFAIYDPGTGASDVVVLDKETQLVWMMEPDTLSKDWSTAVQHCVYMEAGGRMGWRLPTIEELLSLKDASGQSLPPDHPFILGDPPTTRWFWSSTTYTTFSDRAHQFCFPPPGYGCILVSYPVKDEIDARAWCVRGGYGHDAY